MGFFVKKVNLSSMQGALGTVSVFFLHFTYLGDIRIPLPTGLGWKTQKTNQPRFIWMTSTNTEVIKLSIINA